MRCSAHQLVRLQWDEIEGPDERAEARARNHALMTCVTRLTNQIKTKNTKFQELE